MDKLPEFIMNNYELFIGLAVVLVAMVAGPLMTRLQGLNPVGPGDALNLMNHQDALVLDIREDKEYRAGHILGSRHVPMSRLAGELEKLNHDKGKPVIAVCNSGSRSRAACSALSKNGYESVYNLTGGVSAWKGASLPLTKK